MSAKTAKTKQKVVSSVIKLIVSAGAAKPAPPVGPALGQAGLNIMAFCKDFNARTSTYLPDTPIPVSITAFTDKTYDMVVKTPPVSYFVKKALGLKSGSTRPGRAEVGTISAKQIYHIAEVKLQDQEGMDIDSMCRSIMGTCKSMGVRVVARPESTPEASLPSEEEPDA